MESASSLCVLPSHGPPFFQEDNAISETSSRALQLSSGNVGSIPAEPRFDFLKAEFDDQHGQEETTVFNTQTTSREGNHPQAYQRKRQRQRRDGRRQYPWDRDRNFIRYELNSERYRAYRLKCQQGNDQVWPDDVEDCLQYALRVIPVLGRKKDSRVDFNHQQGGRNELIHDFILKWTGAKRGRKQVSSHLQVLKSYLADNPEWMELVTTSKDNDTGRNHRREYAYEHPQFSRALPRPHAILKSNAPPSVQQVDFEMFLTDAAKDRLHTFSSIQSDIGSGPKPLEEVPNWQRAYPDLAASYSPDTTSAELILLETNIELLRKHPPAGSTLCINPFIVVAGGTNFRNWSSTTYLYEEGVRVRGRRNDTELENHSIKLESEMIGRSNHAKITLMMKSQWWARNVIAEVLDRTTKAATHGDKRAIYEAELWGRRFIDGLSMLQEIEAVPRNGDTPQTVAILLWKYRQVLPGETATTTWRKLTPPYLRGYTGSPSPSLGSTLVQRSSTAQRDFECGPTKEYLGQQSLFVDDPESIITGQPSEANSSSSTPRPDSRSLPSSTATSFASSGSGSLYHGHEMAKDERHLSQDWDPDSQEHFMLSQENIYHPHDSAYGHGNSHYYHEETTYPDPSEVYSTHPSDNAGIYQHNHQSIARVPGFLPSMTREPSCQDQYFMAAPLDQNDAVEAFSQQHSQEAASPVMAPDFTEGQIHISFNAHERQSQLYKSSLSAPEADVLPHQYDYHGTQTIEAEMPDETLSPTNSALQLSRRPSVWSTSQDLEILADEARIENQQEQTFTINSAIHQWQHGPSRPSSEYSESRFIDDLQPKAMTEHQSQHHFSRRPSHYSASQDLEDLEAIDIPIHQPPPNDLILHHPQPHHHLDPAQWQTHALWANIHNHSQAEDGDLLSPFSTEVLDVNVDQLPIVVSGEVEGGQGQVIGEIESSLLERHIEDIERDMAREIRRDLDGVD